MNTQFVNLSGGIYEVFYNAELLGFVRKRNNKWEIRRALRQWENRKFDTRDRAAMYLYMTKSNG